MWIAVLEMKDEEIFCSHRGDSTLDHQARDFAWDAEGRVDKRMWFAFLGILYKHSEGFVMFRNTLNRVHILT
jgi:hypothetical protein